MRELVTDAWRMCTPKMLHDLPDLPEPAMAAYGFLDAGEYGELRPLLHPYLHFTDGVGLPARPDQGPGPPVLAGRRAADGGRGTGRADLPVGAVTQAGGA